MSGTVYEEFDDVTYTRFRGSLLRTKGSTHQRDFLKATRNDADFLKFLRDAIATDGTRPLPLLSRTPDGERVQTSTCKYRNSLVQLLGRVDAADCLSYHDLGESHLPPHRRWSNQRGVLGRQRWSWRQWRGTDRQGMGDDGKTATKAIDDCVRTVLRRLSGLPEARGNRTVYVDCPLARAWWRERLVAEISQGDPDQAESVRLVARVNQTYWEELVTLVVSRNSVLGSHAIRDSFVLSLGDLLSKKPETPLRLSQNLRLACRTIGAIQASRELSVLNEREVRSLMDEVVELHHEQALDRKADDE